MSIRINLNQARELLEFFGGEDADMTVGLCGPEAHSGPGLYVWCTEHPGEGSIKLDREPQPADEDGVTASGEASAWWALVMGAAASIEDAANCLRDPDAKKQADGAAKHYREAAQKLMAASGVLGTQGGQSNG